MARVSTQKVNREIAELRNFSTNGALRGGWEGSEYVVTSYSTAIARVNPSEGVAVINNEKYSVTTSRHQGQTRYGIAQAAERLGLEVTQLNTEREFAQWLKK